MSKTFIVLLVLCALCSGCLYTNVQTVLDRDVNETTLGDRVGEASNYGILWLFAWGDAGTQAAAKDGGIEIIHHADQKVLSILFGLYFQTTTVVYGE